MKTVTVKIKQGVKFSPPVNRAVTSKDVKYAFERFFSANVGGQYPRLLQLIEGAPKKPTKGVKPHLRHHDAGRPDDRLQAQRAAGRRVRRGARDADHGAGAGGVREEVRRQEPVDVQHARRRRPARTWSRTTPRATLTGYKPGKSIDARPQPELGPSRPTSARPTSTRSSSETNAATPTCRPARSSTGSTMIARHQPAGADAEGRASPSEGPVPSSSRAAATATSR